MLSTIRAIRFSSISKFIRFQQFSTLKPLFSAPLPRQLTSSTQVRKFATSKPDKPIWMSANLQNEYMHNISENGLRHMQQGNYTAAVQCFQQIPLTHQDYFNAQMVMSSALTYLGRYEKALECIAQVPKSHSAYVDLQLHRGLLLIVHLQRYSEGQACLKKVLKEYPGQRNYEIHQLLNIAKQEMAKTALSFPKNVSIKKP